MKIQTTHSPLTPMPNALAILLYSSFVGVAVPAQTACPSSVGSMKSRECTHFGRRESGRRRWRGRVAAGSCLMIEGYQYACDRVCTRPCAPLLARALVKAWQTVMVGMNIWVGG